MPDQLQSIVQRMIDAGEPEENIASVIKEYKPTQTAPQDKGFWGGVMNTLPTPSKIMNVIEHIPENIQRSINNTALTEFQPSETPIGKMFTGRPYEGSGELVGNVGQAAVAAKLPGFIRSRVGTPEPQPGAPHLDLETPVKAGSLTPEQIMQRVRASQAAEAAGQPSGRIVTGSKPKIINKTAGSGAAASTATPEAAATPASAAQPSLPESWKQFVQPEDLPRPQQGQFAPGIKVLTKKATPTSWTPEAARARLEMEDWHSGAEPGSLEAKQAAGLHKFDAELKGRFAHQLQNQNGYGTIGMLRAMGVPFEALKYPIAYHYGGGLGVGAMGAADLARLAVKYPVGASQVGRAAILANLAAGEPPE